MLIPLLNMATCIQSMLQNRGPVASTSIVIESYFLLMNYRGVFSFI